MKNRFNIWFVMFFIIFAIFFSTIFLGNVNQKRILIAFNLTFLSLLLIYIFGGIGKFATSMIYGAIITVLLVFFKEYDNAIIAIGTFLFAINPLEKLEREITLKFPEENSIINALKGSYQSYYDYRSEIKNYYHMPQTKKIYTNKNYVIIRQFVVIIMSLTAVFLLMKEINNLLRLIRNFNIHLFFANSYSVIVLVILTTILYKKGFQSMANMLLVLVLPPISYSIFLIIPQVLLKNLMGFGSIIFGIYLIIYQYVNYRRRIVYEDYYYVNNLTHIHANALFEPFIYDDAFYLDVKYTIKISINEFRKQFQNIIVYADFKRFFITAYTYDDKSINIYTNFHYKDEKKVLKFKEFLESTFVIKVDYDKGEDFDKKNYEKQFSHTTGYIVARANYLAKIIETLEIKENVILRFNIYFEKIEDLLAFDLKFKLTRLPYLDENNVFVAQADLVVKNLDYVIENQVRDFLLELIIDNGHYIRVLVFY